MLSAVSAKGTPVRLGGNPAGQMRGVGELAEAWPRPLSWGVSSLAAAGSPGQAQATLRRPEVIKLEKQLGGATQRLLGPIQFQARTGSWAKKLETRKTSRQAAAENLLSPGSLSPCLESS